MALPKDPHHRRKLGESEVMRSLLSLQNLPHGECPHSHLTGPNIPSECDFKTLAKPCMASNLREETQRLSLYFDYFSLYLFIFAQRDLIGKLIGTIITRYKLQCFPTYHLTGYYYTYVVFFSHGQLIYSWGVAYEGAHHFLKCSSTIFCYIQHTTFKIAPSI